MVDREKVLNDLQELCEYLFHEYNVCYKGDEEDTYNRFLAANNALNLLKYQQEQKHGHWKDDKYGNMLCSVCGGLAIQSMTGCLSNRHLAPYLSDYCPNCGAKMDGKVKQ